MDDKVNDLVELRPHRSGTERRIPIVRVIDQAAALANELPRRNLVIALEPQPRRRR
ncbi:MAG: hypothetical protein QOF75_14 [Gaiellaceae bacterium]|jgi:hypothetical protein|nr:hypothetical protein [Gaiellaceae bacterium]